MAKDSQSQLKRLKTALRESGVSRSSTAKQGPRKNRVDREKELAKIRERFNPYEVQVNRAKFAVGGRRLKGTEGRPGTAASIAEKMRHETLGRERQQRGRVGGVVDRRFGEGRADLTPEQIQLERYTRERQKSSKRNNFSLEDEDGEGGLTHLGQSLSAMDDFGPAPVSDDEDMGAEMVSRTNFGGFEEELEEDEIIGEDGEKRKKTKAEIMQEIIAKSKQGRSDRQRQAEEDEEAIEALDAELGDLQALLATSERKKPTAADGISADRMQALQEDTDYDKAVKELIYDRRAKASERTKTEEELIEEEAKRLHEQEEARIKRMRGEEVDEDESRSNKRRRPPQGDDLSDDFQSESDTDAESDVDEAGFGRGVNASSAIVAATVDEDDFDSGSESDADDDEDDEDDDGSTSTILDDDPQVKGTNLGDQDLADSEADEDAFESGSDEDDDELPSEELVRAAQEELDRRAAAAQDQSVAPPKSILKTTNPVSVVNDPSELKFTYPCPSSFDQLLAITKPLAATDIPIALHRIRVLHHPRLNPANNEKLSKFLTLLIDYVLTDDIAPSVADYCVTQIHDLSQKYWEPSATHFLGLLDDTRQAMYKDLGIPWIRAQLKFFSLIGQVWSTSDAYHKVVTPAYLVVAQYLAQNSDTSPAGLAIKLVLCNTVAYWARDSKRYVPEAIQTLFAIISSTKVDSEEDAQTLNPNTLENVTDSRLHVAAEKTIMKFATRYISNIASIEIFSPFLPHLVLPDIKDAMTKAVANASKTRRPLALQAHRPIGLASLVPKFEESFSLDKKSYDRNLDRAKDAKLKAEYKDTQRGLKRVLRRDAAFEARMAAKDRREKGATYNAKMKKIENQLSQREPDRVPRQKR